LSTDAAPVLKRAVITNSVKVTQYDGIKLVSGFASLLTTGALIFGHSVAVQTLAGVGLLTTGVAGAGIGSFVNSYTVASDNQTVAKVSTLVDISKDTLYSVNADAALGTTTGSNLIGYHINAASESQLSESSAVATTAQYMIWGTDPADSTRDIVNIYQSVVFGV
jgi:hypothetical protein